MCKNIWLVRHTSFVLLISTSAFEQTKQYCARYASVRYHWQWIILQVAASTLVAAAASASSAAVAPTAVAVAHTLLFVAHSQHLQAIYFGALGALATPCLRSRSLYNTLICACIGYCSQ
jgi:spore coat protein U-like protein